MVSTRSASAAARFTSESPPPYETPTPATTAAGKLRSRKTAAGAKTGRSSAAAGGSWSHTPSPLTLLWLTVSLPLVAWDTGYILLRPHSMPGGSLHWPVWHLYELYGRVDGMYGFKQWNLNNGFTAAQGTMNLIESLLYIAYLGLWYRNAQPTGQKLAERVVSGRLGALAALIGFSAAVMTVSKTVLYWLNEGFSGFDNIGHNTLSNLIFLWIIPNGLWLVFPSYMIYEFGADIVRGLDQASGSSVSIKSE
ncbi:hypothetical protein QBC37DRAFT_157374 [Rhypophila decipiens]|uniref:C6 transcription factor n=1 Tax=Rhypophila decipiens TaxID=261697 RepID=A0AAN6YAC2_9PEZI|nr:hypothetical protein QBC37DRAFT_157374 [Rhypophila decipiens]